MSFIDETHSKQYDRVCSHRDTHISTQGTDNGSNYKYPVLLPSLLPICPVFVHQASSLPLALKSACGPCTYSVASVNSTSRNGHSIFSSVAPAGGNGDKKRQKVIIDNNSRIIPVAMSSDNKKPFYSSVNVLQKPQSEERPILGSLNNSSMQASSSTTCNSIGQSSVNKLSTHSLTVSDVPRFNLLDYALNSINSGIFSTWLESPLKRKRYDAPSPDHDLYNMNNQLAVSSSSINKTTNSSSIENSSPSSLQSHMAKQATAKPIESPSSSYYVGPNDFQLTLSLSKDPWDVSTQNAEWMYLEESGLVELALNLNTSLLLEHLYNSCNIFNSTIQMRLPETGRKYEISFRDMEMTDMETGVKTSLRRKTWSPDIPQQLQSDVSLFPLFWSPQTHDIVLVKLQTRTEEYRTIVDTFLHTMPECCVVGIERIQNKKLYIRYSFQKTVLLDKNSGCVESLNEKLLFHGTSKTPPKKIWQSEDGFDLRYSRRGMWGIGSYFAENASYSDQYAYKYTASHPVFYEMIVANVLTGNATEMRCNDTSRQLTRPPVYTEATANDPEVLYDSVTGFTEGRLRSRIYVLYKFDMAYPSYLIRYFKLNG